MSNPASQSDLELFNLSSMSETLTVVMSEYANERSKKQSFENRGCLIITLVFSIYITLSSSISPKLLFASGLSVDTPLKQWIPAFFLIVGYFSSLFSIFFILKIMLISKTLAFPIEDLSIQHSYNEKPDQVGHYIYLYLSLAQNHRVKNDLYAKNLLKSQIFFIITTIAFLIFLFINQ